MSFSPETNEFNSYTQQNKQLVNWIESLNNASKSKRGPLEQQLQLLSQSYKNAQQKLLSLQKQLYNENLYNQKQRSIIQILKYVLQQNLDDETIITYIMELQNDQSNTSMERQMEKKYQIKGELQQIKQIIINRKTKMMKMENSKDIVIGDLKKQVKKANHIKRQLMQDVDRIINQKQDIQNKLYAIQYKNNELMKQMQQQINKNKQLSQQIIQSNNSKKVLEQQLDKMKEQLEAKLQSQNELMKKINKFIIKMNDKLEETQQSSLHDTVQNLCKKLQKYRKLAQQLNFKVISQNKSNQLIAVLKLFTPIQAHQIIHEFTNHSKQQCSNNDYLLKELQEMSNLYKKKFSQVDICQQQMWSMKIRLLREKQENVRLNNHTTSPYTSDKENIELNSHKTMKNDYNKTTEFDI